MLLNKETLNSTTTVLPQGWLNPLLTFGNYHYLWNITSFFFFFFFWYLKINFQNMQSSFLFLFPLIYFFLLSNMSDLFPFANQCPRQAIRLYTDQSGTERIDSFFLSRTIFLVLFGSRSTVRENRVSSQDRPLSRPLLRTFHMKTFTEECATTSFTHRRTSLAISHTSSLLQWHTLPTNSKTNTQTGDTKKNPFSLWPFYFC